MNIQDILLIYEYNYWANKRILAKCKNVTPEQFIAAAEPQRGSPNLHPQGKAYSQKKYSLSDDARHLPILTLIF